MGNFKRLSNVVILLFLYIPDILCNTVNQQPKQTFNSLVGINDVLSNRNANARSLKLQELQYRPNFLKGAEVLRKNEATTGLNELDGSRIQCLQNAETYLAALSKGSIWAWNGKYIGAIHKRQATSGGSFLGSVY